MNPIVSIVLPAYKAKFLSCAIESILAQTFIDFELIIINDASPENIREIVEKYKDHRITYYENCKNIGGKDLVNNWNKCMEYAQGEFAVLASDDDIYAPEFLQEMMELSKKYPLVNVFHCRIQIIDENSKIIGIANPSLVYESTLDFIYQRTKYNRSLTAQEFLFRTRVWRELGGFVNFPCAWYSDVASWYLFSEGKGICCSPKVLFNWRYSGINVSSKTNNIKQKLLAINQYENWFGEFRKTLTPNNEVDKYILNSLNTVFKKHIHNGIIRDLVNLSCISTFLLFFNKTYNKMFSFRVFLEIFFRKMTRSKK